MPIWKSLLRKKAPVPAGYPVLPSYAQAGWLSRHRKLILTALFIVIFFYSAFFVLIGRFFLIQFVIPLAILAGMIIWALPEREKIPDRLMCGFFVAFMVSQLIWPNYLALSISTLPWITAARLFGVPMLLLFFICLSQSTKFKAHLKNVLGASPILTRLMYITMGIAVFSVAVSTLPGASANQLIIAIVNWFAVFFVGVVYFSRPGNVERFVWILWFTALFWCFMGFLEWRNSQVPWAPHIPSFLKIEDETVQRVLTGSARSATGIYRVQGKFTTSLGLAELMALITPFIIHFMLEGRTKVIRLAAGLTLPMMFWTIVVTDSRLGIVGFFLSFMFYMLIWGARRWRRYSDSLMGPAVTLAYPVIFVGFVAATFAIGRLRNMVWGSGAQAASDAARQTQIELGIQDLLVRPWGYGMGRAASAIGFTSPTGIVTIDNYFLSIALDFGVVGFFVFYGMWLIAIFRGGRIGVEETDYTRMWMIPAVLSLTNFFVIKTVFSQQEGHSLAFAILAMVVAMIWASPHRNIPLLEFRAWRPDPAPSARLT